jgi:hypothetical protein
VKLEVTESSAKGMGGTMNRKGTFCHDSLAGASAGLTQVVGQFEIRKF